MKRSEEEKEQFTRKKIEDYKEMKTIRNIEKERDRAQQKLKE